MTQNEVEGSSSGTTSCNLIWSLPEFSSGGPYDGGESKFKKWSCVLSDGDNFEIHDNCENGGGRGAVGEEGQVMVVKKGPWTEEEDERLKKCVEEHGIGNWITIEKYSGLGRTSKSCRLRWTNHLRPNLKKGSFTKEEERVVIKLHKKYGNKWSYISSKIPGRTDNEIKNFWHGRVRRCRRKFQPIYPENIEDGGSLRDGLDIDERNNVNDDYHNSAAMDGTNNIPSLPYTTLPEFDTPLSHCVPSQQQQRPVINQNPTSAFTALPQTQLFSPHRPTISSTHGFSSSHPPSPTCYPTHVPQSFLTTPSQIQFCSIQQFQSTETPDTKFLSLQQKCSSIQQSNSNTHITFTPLKPPPDLSSLVGQLKGSRGSSSLVSSPPTLTQFLAPVQGSSITATGSSISSICSPKINVSSSVPSSQFCSIKTGSPICSPKLHLYVQEPTSSSVQLQTSSQPSALSSCNPNSTKLNGLTTACPHSPLRLNLTSSIAPHSYPQRNPCAAPSLVYSQFRNSSKSEPPSIQTPTSAMNFTPEIKTNQLETDSERIIMVVDAPMQETQAKADALYKNLPEEPSVDRCLMNNDLHGKILVTEAIKEKVLCQSSREGGFFEKPRTMNLLGHNLKSEYLTREMPQTHDLESKRSCRKVSHNKCLKPETSMGKISRRKGLLSEISKTGVLLVEREKKQILLRELLNESSIQEVSGSQSSKMVDLQLGRISNTTKLFCERVSTDDPTSQISKRKGSIGQNSEEGTSTFENLTSLRNQKLVENMLDISQKSSILLNFEKQICDSDTFGFPNSPKDVTSRLISDSLLGKLSSAQVIAGEVCDEIFKEGAALASQGKHELDTLGPVVSHSPELVRSATGDDKGGNSTCGASNEGHYLNKTSREKYPDSPKEETMEDQFKFIGGGFITGGLVVSQEHESVWDLDQFMTVNMLGSPTPDDKLNCPQPCGVEFLGEFLSIEDPSSRSLKDGVQLDQSLRDMFVGESEKIIALHELTLTEFVSPTSKSTAAHLLTSCGNCSEADFSECYEGVKLRQEIEEDHALPEDLSNLLEFSPTTLPDWHDIGCENSNKMDISFGLEMYHLHPIMR